MASIPSAFYDLFEKKTFAHFATLLPDGTPHVAPVWIDYDVETNRLLVNTERGRRKEKNVRQDPRVALSLSDPDNPYRMMSVTGTVDRSTTVNARAHADELAHRYMNVEEYPDPIETERVLIEIQPGRVSTQSD